MININTLRAIRVILAHMEKDQRNAAYYGRKVEEYRAKARATADARVKSALEAVAREFIRKARGFDESVPRAAGIQ